MTTADLFQTYQEGLHAGQLLLQRCEDCGAHQFYPRILCVRCGGQKLRWEEASGAGTVYSYTVVRRAPSPAFSDQVPYPLALVDLDEGPRLLARVINAEDDALSCGTRVRLVAGASKEAPTFEAEPT